MKNKPKISNLSSNLEKSAREKDLKKAQEYSRQVGEKNKKHGEKHEILEEEE